MSVVIHAIVKVERTQKCAIGSRKAVQMAVKCVVCEGSSPPTLSNLSLYLYLSFIRACPRPSSTFPVRRAASVPSDRGDPIILASSFRSLGFRHFSSRTRWPSLVVHARLHG